MNVFGFPNLSLGLNEVLERPTTCKRIVSSRGSDASSIVRATTSSEFFKNEFPMDVTDSGSSGRHTEVTTPLNESLLRIISNYGSKILLKDSDRKPRVSKKKGKKQSKLNLNKTSKGAVSVDNWEGPAPWDALNGGDGYPKFLCDVMVRWFSFIVSLRPFQAQTCPMLPFTCCLSNFF